MMLPAVLHVTKYICLMFYIFFKILSFLYLSLSYEGCIPLNIGEHNSNGACTTV